MKFNNLFLSVLASTGLIATTLASPNPAGGRDHYYTRTKTVTKTKVQYWKYSTVTSIKYQYRVKTVTVTERNKYPRIKTETLYITTGYGHEDGDHEHCDHETVTIPVTVSDCTFTTGVDTVTSTVTAATDTITSTVTAATATVTSTLTTGAETVTSTVTAATATITSTLTTAAATVTSTVTAATATITSTLTTAAATVTSTVTGQCTTTPTTGACSLPTQAVGNPSFESTSQQSAPWVQTNSQGASEAENVNQNAGPPGFTAFDGVRVMRFNFPGNSITAESFINIRQTLALCTGETYELSFYTWIEDTASGCFVTANIGGDSVPLQPSTLSTTGQWVQNTATYVATGSSELLILEVRCPNAANTQGPDALFMDLVTVTKQ